MESQPIALSSAPEQRASQENGRRIHGPALISVLAALMLTLLLEALDQTVVSTALPCIIGALQGFDRYTWAATSYTLASTTMIPIVGSLIMTAGVFLLTRMTASTSLLETIIYIVIAGIGLGTFFSVLTVAAQNALPRTQLGVGTGAVRYLGQLGAVLGVAIVGTVVNQSLSSDIASRLPANAVKQLTPAGVKFATNPQALVNSTYRDTVVHTAQGFAVRNAVARVPPGPQHDQIAAAVAAQVIQQVQHLLNQVFEALRLSFAVAIQHGFITVLIFCGAAILVTFFLKDVPMVQVAREGNEETGVEKGQEEQEEDVNVLP